MRRGILFLLSLGTLFPLLLSASPPGDESESVCVRLLVRSSEDQQPIPGASIEALEWERGVAAGADGKGEICGPRVESLRVRVSSLGYDPVVRTIDPYRTRRTTIVVDLDPVVEEGETVVVTGHAHEAGSSEAVLSGEELQGRLGTTLAETLRGVGGVSVRSLGPAAAQPVVRGMSGDRIQIAEEGTSTADAAGFSADHATSLDPIGASRIGVIRGPAAFLLSSTPLGGAINVERGRPGGSGTVAGQVTGAYSSGSNGGAIGGGVAVQVVPEVDLDLTGSWRKKGDLRTPLLSVPNSDLETTQLGVGISTEIDRVELSGRFSTYASEYGVPFDGTEAHPEGVRIDMEKQVYAGKLDLHPDSERFSRLELAGRVTRYQHREIEAGGLIGTSYGIVTTSVDGEIDHTFGRDRSPAGVLKFGGEFVDFAATGLQIDPSNRVTLYGALHEHAEFGRFDLAASLRLDHVGVSTTSDATSDERTFLDVSGGIGLDYHPDSLLTLSANLLRSFRAPSINELFSRGPHAANYAYEVGNRALEAERGLGAEIALEVESDRVEGEVRLYGYRFTDYMVSLPTGDTNRASRLPVYRFENIPAALYGFESQVNLHLSEAFVLSGHVSGTWGEELARDTAAARPLREIPPITIGTGIAWEAHPWSASLRQRTTLDQNRPGLFETPTAGGTLLSADLSRSFQIGTTLHFLILRLENILDTKLRDHLSRTKEIYPVAGRSLGVSYRVVW